MERPKRWQLYLIIVVGLLTLYNILPTLIYYGKPLRKPIGEKEALQVASNIAARVNNLEKFTLSWLKAQSKNLGLKPTKIAFDPNDPKVASVTFKEEKEAHFFAKTLERAGSLIPFVPAQLSTVSEEGETTVLVQRKIGVHLDPKQVSETFKFIPKKGASGEVSAQYRVLVSERAAKLALGFGGESLPAKVLLSLKESPTDAKTDELAIRLARSIVEYENAFGETNAITTRYFASFSQTDEPQVGLIGGFTSRLETLSATLGSEITKIENAQESLREKGEFLDSSSQQKLEVYGSQQNTLDAAIQIIGRNRDTFEKSNNPLTKEGVFEALKSSSNPTQTIALGPNNPFVKALIVEWDKETIDIVLHDDVAHIRSSAATSEASALTLEKLNHLLFNEIAKVARVADETITPATNHFAVKLSALTNSSSLLALDFEAVASMEVANLQRLLSRSFVPKSIELEGSFVVNKSEYDALSETDKNFAFLIYAPVMEPSPQKGFRVGSIYVIAKGLGAQIERNSTLSEGPEKLAFDQDYKTVSSLLRQNGFIGYLGKDSALGPNYQNDVIFELDDYYAYLLAATREDFTVKGEKRQAFLEFTDVEQRLLTNNKIDTAIHEDLVKWKDLYQSARVSLDKSEKYDVPRPTTNVLMSNLALSATKYFRGDNRKILKWGLDLSGGKTVRIGLKGQDGQSITNENDINQAVGELYARVNKLGLSEVGIRTEGSTIVLDFPGSQGLTASDLIEASAMYFHVVNEKFTPSNKTLAEAVNTFLDEVWNEAVITNRTDPTSLNEIAWQHLGGSAEHPSEFHPKSTHARLLYENGLRFAGPKASPRSANFDDTLSQIAKLRGDDALAWQGQTYPLLIVFRNYALEGANLTNVQTGYDPSEGNILHFGVASSFTSRDGDKINPRDDFFSWTSQFAEEKVVGTPKETYSQGRGWRMAVILNGSIISAPVLNAPLRDSARISGHFSQREINQLAADLKAGSLSFTPQILSEQNISPDLGKEQRFQGIMAALIGLFLVIAIMCSIYRFSGLIASCAVVLNLLIMWAVLQNLDAALTLPGIAGIILTVGMAVDANVLIFERIREEFAFSARLPSAVQAGYRKAFSAIIDSNLTTIIAAVILLNFDSGPIKGFALTLLIGIASSLFTSLFMTRFFFSLWVQNPNRKTLTMKKIFGTTQFDFLKKAKPAFMISLVLLVGGSFFLVSQKKTIFGMDFTGGYSLSLSLEEQEGVNYRQSATDALVAAGAAKSDFQIRELNKPNQLLIQLGVSMQQSGKPFYLIDETTLPKNPLFNYQEYPRIVWIVDALQMSGLRVAPSVLPTLNLNWNEMSGQLSDTMRNQALFGLALALVFILIYITFRFEFKFAISATLALAHDLLVTLGIIALLHLLFEGIQIDLQVIAALMTIVGYSLNDTIIIFDRIREEVRLQRKVSFGDLINHALNATLSRTLMTSVTTVLVLLALVCIGGAAIRNFALVMTLGVFIGTFSSLFIASPVLLFFHNRELTKQNSEAKKV